MNVCSGMFRVNVPFSCWRMFFSGGVDWWTDPKNLQDVRRRWTWTWILKWPLVKAPTSCLLHVGSVQNPSCAGQHPNSQEGPISLWEYCLTLVLRGRMQGPDDFRFASDLTYNAGNT